MIVHCMNWKLSIGTEKASFIRSPFFDQITFFHAKVAKQHDTLNCERKYKPKQRNKSYAAIKSITKN